MAKMSKFHKQMNRELRKQVKQSQKDWKKDPLKETCKGIAVNAAVDAAVIGVSAVIINKAMNKKIAAATTVGTPAPAKKSILPWKRKKQNAQAPAGTTTPPTNPANTDQVPAGQQQNS